jgi:hypothetical protein
VRDEASRGQKATCETAEHARRAGAVQLGDGTSGGCRTAGGRREQGSKQAARIDQVRAPSIGFGGKRRDLLGEGRCGGGREGRRHVARTEKAQMRGI